MATRDRIDDFVHEEPAKFSFGDIILVMKVVNISYPHINNNKIATYKQKFKCFPPYPQWKTNELSTVDNFLLWKSGKVFDKLALSPALSKNKIPL